MSRIVGVLALVSLLAGGCGGDENAPDDAGAGSPTTEATEVAAEKGPLTYNVAVDGPSPEGKNLQLSTFFPGSLNVHAGDTVVFENKSTQAPHTISFGIKPDRSNSPAPLTKAAAFNPAVFGPCVSAADPSSDLEACPEAPAAEPAPYTGKGYWNSGVLAPAVAPAGTKQVSVTFAESVAPGSYAYACLLHGLMGGSVTVVGSDDTRDAPGEVTTLAARAAKEVADGAAAIPDPAPGPGAVTAGWGDTLVAVNRFSPGAVEVKAGETVTWKATSEYEPHTITFESPFTSPEDPAVVPPAGTASGGDYTGGFTNSGFVGPKPFPSDTFSLRFPTAGTYEYMCAIHTAMAGTVKVT